MPKATFYVKYYLISHLLILFCQNQSSSSARKSTFLMLQILKPASGPILCFYFILT